MTEPAARTDEALEPAERFERAQAWWIASEFVRRHPDWAIRFGDPQSYLAVVGPGSDVPPVIVNPGVVHFFGANEIHTRIERPLSTAHPYQIVHAIERFIGDPPHVKTPASTPRTLAYRLMASILSVSVNDKARWEIRNEIGGDDGFGPIRGGYLPQFPDAARDARSTRSEAWDLGEPIRHFWVVLRDDRAVAMVSADGRAYLHDRTVDLLTLYQASGRSMLRVVAELMGDLLR